MLEIRQLSGLPLRETKTITDDAASQRAGILIGLKLDMFQGASVLRWGYLSSEELLSRGLNEERIAKLKEKLRQAEQIYIKAGGTREDFATAILQGMGNADKAITSKPQSLSGTGTNLNETMVLSASPQTLINSLRTNSGLSGDDTTGDALYKASSSLSKIGGFAQSVADITNALSSAAHQQQGQASTSNVPQTSAKTSGFGGLINPSTIGIAAGVGILGFAISNLELTKEDKKKIKKAQKARSSGKRKTSGSGRPSANSLGAINLY